MVDSVAIAVLVGTFLLAGAVKGVVGLGLPTVSLALLTVAFGLTEAMVLLLVPSFVTNLWQAAVGGHGRAILRRLWPFLVAATATVWLGALALTRVDVAMLSALLGVLLAVYAAVGLSGARFTVSARHEMWVGPLAGAVNGILTGMTGSFVVPGVMYLHALGLSRDVLIQAMGVLFAAATVALALALQQSALLGPELGLLSAAGLVPALVGMVLGQRLRRRLPEDRFRQVLLAALLILGLYIAARALS